jgi:hypothetical protein
MPHQSDTSLRSRFGALLIVIWESGVRLWCEWTARKSIVGASELQFNDGLYAEVQLWCESGPIARRWIVPTCVWMLSDCKNWKRVLEDLPQEVLLEEFYRSWCSETVKVGRVRVFEELPAVFNCSVLTSGVQ